MSQTLVVKIGGGEGVNVEQICADLIAVYQARPLVIVHGVSAMMAQISAERGTTVQMLTSPSGHSFRYTNAFTRDLFVEASARVSRQIQDFFASQGIGTAIIQQSIIGERKTAIRALVDGRVRMIRDDYSGAITGVNADAIQEALNNGLIPIIPPLAYSETDGFLNVDGDRASASIASALDAETLVILSNVRGLYQNFPDEASFIPTVQQSNIDSAMGWAQGRMKRKVLGAQEALTGGVDQVVIADGRSHNPVTSALLGEGTVFVRS
jgi:acetylglutamate/LysW-gamma-L-alpha-aminoadipate kinase